MGKFSFINDRNSNMQSIGDGIKEMMTAFHLENKYYQTLIITKWDLILGPSVVSRTEKIYFKNDTMFVMISSAPLKHQLSLSKSKIMETLNKAVNLDVVKEIVFL